MAKRANGEGSVYQLPDRTWRGSITVQIDGLGRPKRKYVSGKTQKEVREKIRHLLRLKEENALVDPSRMTVAEYLDEWMRDTKGSLKPTTIEKREYIIKLYVTPHIGRYHLQKLTPLDVQRLQTTLLTTPRKPGKGQKLPEGETLPPLGTTTVHGALSLLGSAMRHALQLGLITRNPVEAVKRVKPAKRDMQVWEPSEIHRLILAIQNSRLYGLVYLAITTGLRRGELCGLRRQDIQKGVLHVRQNCVLVGNTPHLQTPKSEKSRRRVPLPADTLEALALHRERQARERLAAGDEWREQDLVFPTPIGTIYHPRNLLRDWYTLLAEAKIRPIRIHDIRHTYASLAIYQGLDPKALADRLGHAHASMTLDVYGHVFEEQRDRAALSLNDLLQGRQTRGAPTLPS
ncbi:tyrosine-type recombinase/integrase [Deinococcus budaensis]|uniref:Integrase n=1 Tax=Deinococcus budaensis TaxID=1665626 RepID=A0A7W8GFP5_9DEIO|nr:integrase [Deinococcus budaensis]